MRPPFRCYGLLAVSMLASWLAACPALAQGTVNLSNTPSSLGGEGAPVYDADGVTRLSGASFSAQLYAGPAPGNLDPVGAPVPLRTGVGAGYFVGGTRVIASVLPGAGAYVQVRVWRNLDGPTYELAAAAGGKYAVSNVLLVRTGGEGEPPSFPASLSGLSFGPLRQGLALWFASQPASQVVALGATVTFSVQAQGIAPWRYQWRKDDQDLPGAVGDTLTLVNVQPTDTGAYTVVVRNEFVAVTSALASLAVVTPPAITAQPTNQTVVAGATVQFQASVGGSPPFAFQWFLDGAPILGATAATLWVTNAQLAHAGAYTVWVTNAVGTARSQPASLTVHFSLATVSSAGGTIARTPDWPSYPPDTLVGLTALAQTNYAFTGWGGDVSGASERVDLRMDRNRLVTANFARTYALVTAVVGTGTVSVAPGTPRYVSGDVVNLTASASPGFSFARWEGASTSTLPSITLTMDADKTLSAIFKPSRTLSTLVSGQGMISRLPEALTYPEGATVELRATAADGWQFVQWTGALGGATNPATVTLDTNLTVRAVFKRVFQLSTTVVGLGAIVRDPSQTNYVEGAVVTLTAVPGIGQAFRGWSGSITTNINPLRVLMDRNKSFTASFARSYTLAATALEGGRVIADPAQASYEAGALVRITAQPAPGYYFAYWSGANSSTNRAITLTMDADKAVTATFRRGVSLQLALIGQGTVTRTPEAQVYLPGATVRLEASAAPGWEFLAWGEALTNAPNPATLRLDNDTRVTATFKRLFTLRTHVTGHGGITLTPAAVNFLDGTRVALRALPQPGHRFIGWSGGLRGTGNPATLLMRTNQSVTAAFQPVWTLDAAADVGGAVRLTPALPEYLDGTLVKLVAVPAEGFAFTGWRGDATSTTNPLVTLMAANRTFRAAFRDVAPPRLLLASPQAGPTANEIVSLDGTVTDNVGVASLRWERDDAALGELPLVDGRFVLGGLRLARGTNRFRVRAVDPAGNASSAAVEVIWVPSRTLSLGPLAQAQEGTRLEVPIQLRSLGEVGGMSFLLRYDDRYLSEPQWTWTSAVPAESGSVSLNTPGQILATFSLPAGAIPPGDAPIAVASFRVRSVPATVSAPMDLEVATARNAEGSTLTFGTEVVGSGLTLLKRQVTGDNNGNNRLDVGDLHLMQRLVTGRDELRAWDVNANDLNSDSRLDSADVLAGLALVAGSIPAAPPLLPGGEHIWLSPANLVGMPGDFVQVRVLLTNVQSRVSGLSFALEYPPTALRLLGPASHLLGPLVPSAGSLAAWDVAPAATNYSIQSGRAVLAVVSPVAWPAANGVLAEFTFQVQPGATNQYFWPLQVSGVELTADGYRNRQLAGTRGQFYRRGGPVLSGTLSPPPPLPAKGFRLVVQGPPGRSVVIEASGDLSHWSVLVEAPNPEGTLDFLDDAAQGLPSRFYRARLPE